MWRWLKAFSVFGFGSAWLVLAVIAHAPSPLNAQLATAFWLLFATSLATRVVLAVPPPVDSPSNGLAVVMVAATVANLVAGFGAWVTWLETVGVARCSIPAEILAHATCSGRSYPSLGPNGRTCSLVSGTLPTPACEAALAQGVAPMSGLAHTECPAFAPAAAVCFESRREAGISSDLKWIWIWVGQKCGAVLGHAVGGDEVQAVTCWMTSEEVEEEDWTLLSPHAFVPQPSAD